MIERLRLRAKDPQALSAITIAGARSDSQDYLKLDLTTLAADNR